MSKKKLVYWITLAFISYFSIQEIGFIKFIVLFSLSSMITYFFMKGISCQVEEKTIKDVEEQKHKERVLEAFKRH